MSNIIMMGIFIVLICIFKLVGLSLTISMLISSAVLLVVGTFLGTIKWVIATLILENKCNPYPLLKKNEKDLKQVTKEDEVYHKLNVEKSKILIALGEFEECKNMMLDINVRSVASDRNLEYTYYINLMKVMFEMGDIKEAEELYQREIHSYNPSEKHMKSALKIANAERLLFLGFYDESRREFNEILQGSVNNMVKARVLFGLASIDKQLDEEDKAVSKYKEVAKIGNKLGVAKKAREILAY